MRRLKDGMYTEKERAAAALLLKGFTYEEVSKKTGISIMTLRRRMRQPEFIEYQNLIREGMAGTVIQSARDDVYSITRSEIVEILSEIARKKDDVRRIKACEVLINLFGWQARGQAVDPQDPAGGPEKPDIYRAAWMSKPQ